MSKKIRTLAFVIALGVFCVSGYFLVMSYYHEFVANRALEEIRQETIMEIPIAKDPNDEEGEEVEVFSTIFVDFEMLQGINSDIIGWIHIPDAFVSYPILFGNDNQYYLNRTFDRRHNPLGSIFIDFRNNPEFRDLNTIIYGHDTRNDAKFGSLKRFLEQEYAEANRYIHIIKPHAVYVYEIFAIYETLATSDTYTIQFPSRESWENYIRDMVAQTVFEMAPPPTTERIITLSTCVPNRREWRLVIQAKLIETHSTVAGGSDEINEYEYDEQDEYEETVDGDGVVGAAV